MDQPLNETRRCALPGCLNVFVPHRGGRSQKYCCHAHKELAYRLRKPKKSPPKKQRKAIRKYNPEDKARAGRKAAATVFKKFGDYFSQETRVYAGRKSCHLKWHAERADPKCLFCIMADFPPLFEEFSNC